MTTWEVGNDIAVTDVARCDNILFVLNVGQAVLRVDLKTGELLAPVGLEFRIRSLNRGLGHHCVAPEF